MQVSVVTLLLFVVCSVCGVALGEGDYLYVGEDVSPVIEYIPPDSLTVEEGKAAPSPKTQNENSTVDDPRWHPHFLNSTDNGHRIVEFYAPWCPHCQHYKPKYVELARKARELAAKENTDIKFYAVSCTAHKEICQNQKVEGYPRVKFFKAGSTNGTEVDRGQLHPFTVLQLFGITVSSFSTNEETVLEKPGKEEEISTPKHKRTKDELYGDAFLSFDFSMRNGIYMSKGPLVIPKRTAFDYWTHLLHRTLPPTWKIHGAIRAIQADFDSAAREEKKLIEILDQHKPEDLSWSIACTHGDSLAGYTCGLWELFHIMTIGLVEWNTITPDEEDQIATMDAAEVLRDFISNFFGCEVCQHNFLQMYDACAHERCHRLSHDWETPQEWRQLALWLWETHNDVNVRLMKERAERDKKKTTSKDEVAALWPSRSDCPRCWHEDGTWDEDKVYSYLRLEYWPDDEASVAQWRQLHHNEDVEEEDEIDKASFLPFLPAGAASIVGVLVWLVKKKEKERSGLHKKVDGEINGKLNGNGLHRHNAISNI